MDTSREGKDEEEAEEEDDEPFGVLASRNAPLLVAAALDVGPETRSPRTPRVTESSSGEEGDSGEEGEAAAALME